MSIRILPPVPIEGHQISTSAGPDHPMRVATRRAAGLAPEGWTTDLRDDVQQFFDGMAAEWNSRSSEQRKAVVEDALRRGLAELPPSGGGLAIEVGSGTGAYSDLVAQRFQPVLAVDLSFEMLRRAPAGPARRVRADGSRLPVVDRSASAIVLINAFVFPDEVNRVLAPGGALVWVNSSGEQTPIHLSPDDLVAALPGHWSGVSSRAGAGLWCVLTREA